MRNPRHLELNESMLHMENSGRAGGANEDQLRRAIDGIADQLCVAVDGRFDFRVRVGCADETVEKLQMLVNLVLDAACRSFSALEAKVGELETATDSLSSGNLSLRSEMVRRQQAEDELRLRETKFRAILQSIHDPTLTVNARGLIQEASDSLHDVLGWKPSELVGRNINVLIPEPHHSQHDRYLADHLRTGGTAIIGQPREMQVVRKDGSLVDCELTIWRVDVPGEDEPLFTGIIRDISERKRLEQEVASLARFVDENPNPVLRVDRNGILLYGNAASTLLLHVWHCQVGMEVPAILKSHTETALQTGKIHYIDLPFGKRVISLNVVPVAEFGYVNLYGQDVTDRAQKAKELKAYAASLEDSQRRLQEQAVELQERRQLTKAVNADLLAVNSVHERLFACRSIAEVCSTLTGTLVDQFGAYFSRVWLVRAGDLCHECVLAEHCREKVQCLHLIASSGFYESVNGSHRRVPLGAFKIGRIAAGEGRTVTSDATKDERIHDREWAQEHGLQSFAGFPLANDGKVIGVMAMFSQHKLAPHKLETLELLARVGVAAMENVRQIEAVEQANRAKSEFLANVSHEVRTPMTAILGYADVLADNVTLPENVESVRIIRRNGEHLLEIINDILDLSKIEAGKTEVAHVRFSPVHLVADTLSLMRVKSDAKGLSLTVEYHGPIPQSVHSDPTRLRQILINLIGNAIKFTEVGGIRLIVRLIENDSDPALQFDVIDTGIGIEPEQQTRLFKPFSQADNSLTRKVGGTGLGLSISRRLAQMLGGNITCSSNDGGGCTFRVTIATGSLAGVPMDESPAEAIQDAPSRPTEPEPEPAKLHYRILFAEDGPDNQRLIAFVLRKAGADVTVAENGQIAFDAAIAAESTDRPFDAVLMDMQMPVLDGYEATRRLREAGFQKPIIALTAHAMSDDRQKCLEAGCDEFASKPIKRDELIRVIQACIQQHDAESAVVS